MKNKNFGRKRQAIYILSNRKSTRIIKTLMDFFFFIKVKIKMVCFSVPSFEVGGGFLLNGSTEPSIYKLSSRAPRFFLPGHGRIFLLIVRIWTVYTASILLASSRILIAAFRSLSISFPHVQRYTLSDNPSSFFIFPHLLHFLLEGKKRSIFTNFFPFQASL